MATPIGTPGDLPLFAAAGIELGETAPKSGGGSRPKRQRKPKPPTPAERAASGRLEGARRSRGPVALGQRSRVGQPRSLVPAPVLAFPLVRNAHVLAEIIEKLPHGYDDRLESSCDRVARNIEKRLLRRGVSKQSARACAMDVLHEVYTKRVNEAHKEAGTL